LRHKEFRFFLQILHEDLVTIYLNTSSLASSKKTQKV